MTSETQIRELLHRWATATRDGDDEAVLSNHASDVLIVDVLAPLQYQGAEAYRKSWEEWQPSSEGESLFELPDLAITAGEEVAFCSCLIQCGGTSPTGKKTRDWVRATFCLTKPDGKWMVRHQPISMPVSRKGD
ncbi:MAG: nuclear transport factor 2 family protein [Sphingobacteriaceae bacterium]|nr:nuclear transport factor 2 family protein [Cytophagaceae bacterium]